MRKSLDVEFLLQAEVNGQRFQMNGTGKGDSNKGTLELHLKADPVFPPGFDPVTCPLICSHPTSSFFAAPRDEDSSFALLTGGCYSVDPARHGTLANSKGQELLDLRVTGRTVVTNGKLTTTNMMQGTSLMPRMARNLTPMRDYILPAGAGAATGIVRYQMVAMDGEVFDGQTVVPYRWQGEATLERPLVRLVESIDVHWNGGREVSAYYRLAIAALSEPADIEAYPIVVAAKAARNMASA